MAGLDLLVTYVQQETRLVIQELTSTLAQDAAAIVSNANSPTSNGT